MLAAIRYHYPQSSGREQTLESKTELDPEYNVKCNQKLLQAAEMGNYEELQSMIQEGANVNIYGTNGSTSLILAAENGHDECVNLLIKSGACVNDKETDILKNTALMCAVREGKNNCVKLLIRAGADVNSVDYFGETLLFIAITKQSKELVDILLQSGANVNKIDAKGISPLHYTVLYQQEEFFRSIYEAGADVNISDNTGSTVLMALAGQGLLSKIESVLKAGAYVNAYDKNENTALLYATKFKHKDCVRKLVQAGADVNVRNKYGETALIFAVRNMNHSCVSILLEVGADVNASIVVPGIGSTALLEAALVGDEQLVRKLLQANAKINVIDKNGYNALTRHIATGAMNWEICWMLYAAGEKLIYGISRAHVPDYLKQNEIKLDFNHICRTAIRKHLLDVDPYSHLFGRIPRLGLPCVVTEYLLYDVSLENGNDDEIVLIAEGDPFWQKF